MSFQELADNSLAQVVAAVLTVAGGWRLWRSQQTDDSKGQAEAKAYKDGVATLSEIVDGLRAELKEANERVDRFAQERNEALQKFWEISGQLNAMRQTIESQTKTIEVQTQQLNELRSQVNQLKEQLNAK